jgi:L-alanine-DL-glutamate epimerase-like enolase superfamily enzyme
VTIFALSGVDIALWDLKAKAEGVDLATLIAGRRLKEKIETYASLVRYGEPELVARFCQQVTREGYASAKLHEVAMPAIRAGRAAMDPAMTLTIDVNCAWTEEHAASVIPELKALNTLWLE